MDHQRTEASNVISFYAPNTLTHVHTCAHAHTQRKKELFPRLEGTGNQGSC